MYICLSPSSPPTLLYAGTSRPGLVAVVLGPLSLSHVNTLTQISLYLELRVQLSVCILRNHCPNLPPDHGRSFHFPPLSIDGDTCCVSTND